jgi:energy-coupling factor transporter ATP-binding protein EcfA2
MVDPLMSQTINKLIRKMQNQLGMTQIVVTHDIANCAEKVADRAALLDGGSLCSSERYRNCYASTNPVVHEFVHEDPHPVRERSGIRLEVNPVLIFDLDGTLRGFQGRILPPPSITCGAPTTAGSSGRPDLRRSSGMVRGS